MSPRSYKVANTHDHKISGWKILSIIFHARAPHLVGMNFDVRYDLSTLEFKNGRKLEYFHIIILRLQEEIIPSGETFFPTILLFQYMKSFSDINKIKALITPKMTYIIVFLDNNVNHMSKQDKYLWTLLLSGNHWSPN